MKPLTFEYILENNPLRSLVREYMEVKPLRVAANVGEIYNALQIACGNGNSAPMIMKYFAPKKLSAIDQKSELISIACKKKMKTVVDFSAQDIYSLKFEDNCFDAIFNLGDLHNYINWEDCILELKRVLRTNGLFIFEELSAETFSYSAGKLFKKLTEHPYDKMITIQGIKDFVVQNGFVIEHFEEKKPLNLLKYFIMVARKK